MSVEALERTHRQESCTPPAAIGSKPDLENDLKSKLNISGGKAKNKPRTKQKSPASAAIKKESYASAVVTKVKQEPDEPELLSPMVFSQPNPVNNGTPDDDVTPLTQGQLVQVCNHLQI